MPLNKKPKRKDYLQEVVSDLICEKEKRINSLVDADLFKELKQEALNQNTTIRELLDKALRNFLHTPK